MNVGVKGILRTTYEDTVKNRFNYPLKSERDLTFEVRIPTFNMKYLLVENLGNVTLCPLRGKF